MSRNLFYQNFLSIANISSFSQQSQIHNLTGISYPRRRHIRDWKCCVKQEKIEENKLVMFLYQDLQHHFDDQGIDRSLYDEEIKFQDPITKYNNITGYIFNINLLRIIFNLEFLLHYIKQTGPYEITTKWTLVMKFIHFPLAPELVFTGISIMGINPKSQKFSNHRDFWDNIEDNDYFSLEGLWDVIKQLQIYKAPNLESPKYQVLKRTANYEVRRYSPFVVVETKEDKISGSKGFDDIVGYIFGKNSTREKIPMTTPIYIHAYDDKMSKITIQIVIPLENDFNSLPEPSTEALNTRKVEWGIVAVSKFNGDPTDDIVSKKEKKLRFTLVKDGLEPKQGYMFACYNDPRKTWSFFMRNEVVIQLEDFSFD